VAHFFAQARLTAVDTLLGMTPLAMPTVCAPATPSPFSNASPAGGVIRAIPRLHGRSARDGNGLRCLDNDRRAMRFLVLREIDRQIELLVACAL